MRLRLREPFSGLSHLAGVAFSAAGLILLLTRCAGDGWRVAAFGIYGASLILLYSASAVYHLLTVDAHIVERLRKFDHMGIFILIAGTYTPVCLVPLRGPWGWTILAVVWTIAFVGVTAEIFWKKMPDWFDLVLYIAMGWMALLRIGPIGAALGADGLFWLLAGGILYTVGAVVYATERPRLWPGTFGSHDLWHLFVLGGSAAHFMMMLSFVSPSMVPSISTLTQFAA